MYDIINIDNMVKMQFDIDDESYYRLSALKGTKRSWAKFLKEELLNEKNL